MSAAATPIKQGTPMREPKPQERPPATLDPVIPTSWLAPDEQRRLVLWSIGLIEVMKVWDSVAPHFMDFPTGLSTVTRVRGPWSAGIWTTVEVAAVLAIALLRIPNLAPEPRGLFLMVPLFALWNIVCWFLSDPVAFVPKVSMFGPVHLGEEGFLWGWLYMFGHVVSRLVFGSSENISGVHKIRLLPYSTATLNPLSMSYCLPPGSREPTYIPVVFNNSAPHTVSFNLRSLDTQELTVQSIAADKMTVAPGWQALRLEGDDDDEEADARNLHRMVQRNKPLELERYHSVRPSEALTVIPADLDSSQTLLFLAVDKPSVITLNQVVDRRGDLFNLTPHREAVIIECPSGGDFVEDEDSKKQVVKYKPKKREPLIRCINQEEVVNFSARGVAPLKAHWKQWINDVAYTSGAIEGIEDTATISDTEKGHFRQDKVSKSHIVPLRVEHSKPGKSVLRLTSVVDALGNTYTPSGDASSIEFEVLHRRSVSFDCPNKPIRLLVGGTVRLPIKSDGNIEHPMDIAYRFTAPDGAQADKSLTIDASNKHIEVDRPGTFTLLDVSGTCPGTILEPSRCSVQLVQQPTVDINVDTIHECAVDVGVSVTFEFTGAPPFTVNWNEKRKGEKERGRTITFKTPVATLDLRPEKEGKYTYTFDTISDANYKDIKVNKAPITQVVHPPASVDITSRRNFKYWACSPDEVEIDLSIKGNDPLQLTYRTSWDHNSHNMTVPVKSGNQRITVPVPKELQSGSGNTGSMSVTLVSVEDAKGCIKRLASHQIDVTIDRQIPTAQFSRPQEVVVKEGESVTVPLRLSGNGPWKVTYTLDGKEQTPVSVRSLNSPLTFTQKGVYQLVQVEDANCPGLAQDTLFSIAHKPRPSASISPSVQVTRDGSNVFRHAGFCADESDAVAIGFTGASPFTLSYRYKQGSHHAKERTLNSAQDTGILHLDTAPGHHVYEFYSVSDSNYARTPVKFSLEHDVHSRPSAGFSKQNTRSLCRDSSLVTDAKIGLSGKAPFMLQLGVRRPASADVTQHEIAVPGHEWRVELPDITVTEVGRYEIIIMAMSDASGCAYVFGDNDVLTTSLDVVETARVVPISHDEDVCVGDTLDFLLQGTAPWIVEYQWDKRTYAVTSSAPRFSRAAESAGTFTIRSIALKDRAGDPQCKRSVDIQRTIHPLPRARIQDGIDNLREGDKPATFAVRFQGTPPFTFSYTRSEVHNGRPRVVETQTITDIWENSYAISSSAPGDYEVTSVSDKFCRYPRLSRREE